MKKISFKRALGVVVNSKLPEAEKLADATGRSVLSCLSTIIRPHIGYHLNPETTPSEIDHREREWKFTMQIYDLRQGMVGAPLVDERKDVIVVGMETIANDMTRFVRHCHSRAEYAPPEAQEFNPVNLKKRLGGMRPAISKSGGYANTSIQYVVDDDHYLLTVQMCRAELSLDKQDDS